MNNNVNFKIQIKKSLKNKYCMYYKNYCYNHACLEF